MITIKVYVKIVFVNVQYMLSIAAITSESNVGLSA